jgi:hypothetical protein
LYSIETLFTVIWNRFTSNNVIVANLDPHPKSVEEPLTLDLNMLLPDWPLGPKPKRMRKRTTEVQKMTTVPTKAAARHKTRRLRSSENKERLRAVAKQDKEKQSGIYKWNWWLEEYKWWRNRSESYIFLQLWR